MGAIESLCLLLFMLALKAKTVMLAKRESDTGK